MGRRANEGQCSYPNVGERIQTSSTKSGLAPKPMARVHILAAISLAGALAGCGAAAPPAELSGLWSAGPAACAAGVGVRFGADKIAAVYDHQHETLFEKPRYRVTRRGDHFRVRIDYALPHQAGGVESVGAYGVLVLDRGADGGLKPESHELVDGRTGSVRIRIAGDPAMTSMALQPCGERREAEGLRGRDTL